MRNAAIWIMLYGLTYTVSQALSAKFRINAGISAVAMCIYVVILVVWIWKKGKRIRLGLNYPKMNKENALWHLVGLLILPAYNLLVFRFQIVRNSDAVLMASVAITEEVFFRGYVFHLMQKKNRKIAPWFTSAVFALAHGVNLIQGRDWVPVVVQILCAFCVGLHYCAVTDYFGSIVPCMAAHIVVNLTGTDMVFKGLGETLVLFAVLAIHYLCGVNLISKQDKDLGSKSNEAIY